MKELELGYTAGREDCDFPLYKDISLPIVMLQGWFNDQHECFELFFNTLTCEEQTHLFTDRKYLNSVKAKYKNLWDDGIFEKYSVQNMGEHKQWKQLSFSWFAWWAGCVSRSVREYGSLDVLLETLETVEVAHDEFKPWFYKTKKIRNLNAADAARILARYGYLEPESRPLLARGALRGAALLLNNEPHWKRVKRLENEYSDAKKRECLEWKAAEYVINHLSFAGKFQMEMGESWFCNEVHKKHHS